MFYYIFFSNYFLEVVLNFWTFWRPEIESRLVGWETLAYTTPVQHCRTTLEHFDRNIGGKTADRSGSNSDSLPRQLKPEIRIGMI